MNAEYLHYQTIANPNSDYGKGIAYQSMMKRQIRKHSSYLQPIFEAISNSLESKGVSKIEVALSCNKTLSSDFHDFQSVHVTDNGEGFTDENFERFVTLFDDTKGYNNFGTGRIQFLHYFKYTQIRSVYKKGDVKRLRIIVLSNDFFNRFRTSILTTDCEVDSISPIETTVSFFSVLSKDDKSLFQELTPEKLRHEILTHYLSKFCLNKDVMPSFHISKYVNEVEDVDHAEVLSSQDIPVPDFQKEFKIPYSSVSSDGKEIVHLSNKFAKFNIQVFPLPYTVISKNEVKLTSKGESVDTSRFDFNLIKDAPRIGETYLLFLVSSDYLTQHDQDERGKLKLYSRKEYLSSHGLFSEPVIVIEDIQDNVIDRITDHYPQIQKAKEQHELDLKEMADFFSLDYAEIRNLGIRSGDSTEAILRRYHEYNGSIQAKKEAQVKNLYDSLQVLVPGDKTFVREVNSKVKSLTTLVPQFVRANLTGYIARRKVVLQIFKLAIAKQLECQKEKQVKKSKKTKKNHTPQEKFLHNIIFTQHSNSPIDSNLWLLSDEFVRFEGVSEKRLLDVTYKGVPFLREDLSEEERGRLKHFEHDDITARPDILLFPEEHKCVIIEFKSPNVELANQIEQINQYASVIREFSKEEFEVTTFYAYLIGEKLDLDAFIRKNGDFEKSYYFNYAYCPDRSVWGGDHRTRGSMYIEVLQYSTLLERATARNKIFTDHIE